MRAYDFTENLRRALAMAREIAQMHGARVITPTHLLLGVLSAQPPHNGGVGLQAIRAAGVDLVALRTAIAAELAGPGSSAEATDPDLPYSSDARRALELAMDEAGRWPAGYLGTEHLLLGLFQLGEKHLPELRLLASAGATEQTVRTRIAHILGTPVVTRDPAGAESPTRIRRITVAVEFAAGPPRQDGFDTPAEAIQFLQDL